MPLDDQTKAAFASVNDLTKQLITLGTAIITLEVVFASGFFKQGIPNLPELRWSWILLLVSVVAGVWVLMALAGTLAKGTNLKADSVYAWNIRWPSLIQVFSFAGGMVSTLLYGLAVLGK